MRERGGKKASFKNGKMSVVPINNLGFSVRQLWGVLWIPAMGPSLLPAVELPGSSELCVCVLVCLRICVSAVGAAPEGQQGILRFRCQDYGVAGVTARPLHIHRDSTKSDTHTQPHMAEACFREEWYNLQ